MFTNSQNFSRLFLVCFLCWAAFVTQAYTQTFPPIGRCFIIDGNGDGRADTLFIEFTQPITSAPDSIPSITWPSNSGPSRSAVYSTDTSLNQIVFESGTGNTHIIPGSGARVVIVDLSATPFELGHTTASTTDPPMVTLPNGHTFIIEDKVNPVVTAATKLPSKSGPGLSPDTMQITLSEPIQNLGVPRWDLLFAYYPGCNKSIDSIPLAHPTALPPAVSADGLTVTFYVSTDLGSLAPRTGDCLFMKNDAPFADLRFLQPSPVTVQVEGDDANASFKAFILAPVLSSGPDKLTTKDGAPIILERKWFPPMKMNEDGTVDVAAQGQCNGGWFNEGSKAAKAIPENCLSILVAITRGGYTASINIFDNLGKFIHSSTQKFGSCGELSNVHRAATGGYVSMLIWNQKEEDGSFVGSGVYIWQVTFNFDDGTSKTKYYRQGIARGAEPPGGTCAVE